MVCLLSLLADLELASNLGMSEKARNDGHSFGMYESSSNATPLRVAQTSNLHRLDNSTSRRKRGQNQRSQSPRQLGLEPAEVDFSAFNALQLLAAESDATDFTKRIAFVLAVWSPIQVAPFVQG